MRQKNIRKVIPLSAEIQFKQKIDYDFVSILISHPYRNAVPRLTFFVYQPSLYIMDQFIT